MFTTFADTSSMIVKIVKLLSTEDRRIAFYWRQLYYLPKIVKLLSTEDRRIAIYWRQLNYLTKIVKIAIYWRQ